jgi:hypothetical protein
MAHRFANSADVVASVCGGGSLPQSVENARDFHHAAYTRAATRNGGAIPETAKDDSDGGDDDSPIAAAGQFVASGLNVVSSGINALTKVASVAEDATLSNGGGRPLEVTGRGDVPLTGELATASGITGSSITATDPVAKPSTKNENSGSIGLGSRAAFGIPEITGRR